MMQRENSIEPPRLAAWLLSLFLVTDDLESILGDLQEEFSSICAKAGRTFARRWYWRQVLKSIVYLLPAAAHVAPWSTAAALITGFLVRRWIAGLPGHVIFATLEKYEVYQHHFHVYMFFASTGIDLGHVLTFVLVGCLVALVAKRTEMPATILLGLLYGMLSLIGSLYVVHRTGDLDSLWRLTWYFADSTAIVIGGVMVRTRRLRNA